MKKIAFVFLWFSTVILASPNPRWGEISSEEKQYEKCSFEEEANAVVLSEKGSMAVSFEGMSLKVFRRIKILDPKGFSHGNITIRFQGKDNFEEVKNLKAQIFYPTNAYSQAVKLSNDDFYLKDINATWKKYDFTFPKLQTGAIIEYEYTLYSKNLAFLDTWEFQHEIPTEYSEFKIDIEDQMSYRPIVNGKQLLEQVKAKKRTGPTWILEKIKSYSGINYTYNIRDYINKINFQLESYSYSGTFVSKWKELLSKVRDEYKPYYRSKPLQAELSKVEKASDSLQYLKNIVDYFKTHYAWNEGSIIGGSLLKSQNELINFKRGSRSELNVLLNALIKEAGFNTELILMGQRHYGRPVVTYPSLQQFTGGLSVVFLQEGGSYLFDATNLDEYPFGYAPPESYNYAGLLVGKEEKWVGPVMLLSEQTEIQYYDLNANKYTNKSIANGYFVKNKELNGQYITNSIETEDWVEMDQKSTVEEERLKQETVFIIPELPDLITIKNPLAKNIEQYQFEEEERFAPYEFEFPYSLEARVVVKLPEGFTVKNIEAFTSKIQAPELGLLYTQDIQQKKGTIMLNYKFIFRRTSILPGKEKPLKEFFKKVQNDLNHQIIIVRN